MKIRILLLSLLVMFISTQTAFASIHSQTIKSTLNSFSKMINDGNTNACHLLTANSQKYVKQRAMEVVKSIQTCVEAVENVQAKGFLMQAVPTSSEISNCQIKIENNFVLVKFYAVKNSSPVLAYRLVSFAHSWLISSIVLHVFDPPLGYRPGQQ
jgi:hypothetical protein